MSVYAFFFSSFRSNENNKNNIKKKQNAPIPGSWEYLEMSIELIKFMLRPQVQSRNFFTRTLRFHVAAFCGKGEDGQRRQAQAATTKNTVSTSNDERCWLKLPACDVVFFFLMKEKAKENKKRAFVLSTVFRFFASYRVGF